MPVRFESLLNNRQPNDRETFLLPFGLFRIFWGWCRIKREMMDEESRTIEFVSVLQEFVRKPYAIMLSIEKEKSAL